MKTGKPGPTRLLVVAAALLAPAIGSEVRGENLAGESATIEDLREVLSKAVSRDAMCGSVFGRIRDREICSEESWGELCGKLRSVRTLRPETARSDPEPGGRDSSMRKVDRSTGQYVAHASYDLLCDTANGEANEDDTAWNYLRTLGHHGQMLEQAANGFAAELRSAVDRITPALSDFSHGVKVFRVAQEGGYGQSGSEPAEPFRFIDTEGEDLTVEVLREIGERGEQSTARVREFRGAFAAFPLARFEIATAEARLHNGLSLLAWAVANLVDSDQRVDIPFWLTGGELSVPGSEIPMPSMPPVFRVGTSQSPLDETIISDGQEVLDEFLQQIDDDSDGEPTEASCAGLARVMNDLETEVQDEIERLNRDENPMGFRSARSELIAFQVLAVLSRGNRTLLDACGLDRNALRWHRRLIQHTVDLTRDLQPEFGGLLEDLLQNTFSERVDSPSSASSAGSM